MHRRQCIRQDKNIITLLHITCYVQCRIRKMNLRRSVFKRMMYERMHFNGLRDGDRKSCLTQFSNRSDDSVLYDNHKNKLLSQ